LTWLFQVKLDFPGDMNPSMYKITTV